MIATQPLPLARMIDNWTEYSCLPDPVKNDVWRKLKWIYSLESAGRMEKKNIMKLAARDLDCSPAAVYRYMNWYRLEGWTGLIDERCKGVGSKGLPERFKSWVAGIYDAHQRDNDDAMEVWRKVLDAWNIWQAGRNPADAIPGYETCPPAMPATGYPLGWSYDGIRKLRPRPVERAITKHGRKEASKFQPPILTTRCGSAVLSRLLFDDQDYDNLLSDGFLAIAGIDTVSRPVGFNCVDFYTGLHVDHHLRIMYKDPDDKKNKTLSRKEAVWFIIKQLQNHGWREDDLGTEIIVEHGGMNSWAAEALISLGGHHSFDDALYALSGGKCYVNRSGKFEGPVFADMCFRCQSTGNFRFKTWIESAFRLVRTYMQALPGPTGSHARINKREEIYGIKIADEKLLTAIHDCPDRSIQEFLVENFRRELLDLPTFSHLIWSVYRAINLSSGRKLEGWKRCGFHMTMWRINENSTQWFAESELSEMFPDPEERQLILRKINSRRDLLIKDVPMCSQSAFDMEMSRDRRLFHRLPDSMVGLLLPREWAKPVTIASNHTFTLLDPIWNDDQMYVASWNERDSLVSLDGGKQVMVYHNQFTDGRAHLHSLDGSYITTLYPEVRAETFNKERTLEQLKMRSRITSAEEAHVRARAAGIGEVRTANHKYNRQLIDLTREDRKRSANAAQAARTGLARKRHQTAGDAADQALACIPSIPDDTFTDDLNF